MQLTKSTVKTLRYLYRQKNGSSYLNLKNRFGEFQILNLISAKYITHNYNFPKDSDGFPVGSISDETLCFITDSGRVEVESRQWFDFKFFLLQVVLPIVIAIITTLITIFLTALL